MKKTKKLILFFIGSIFVGFGVSFGNRSLLGGNAMSVFVLGLSKVLPISMGTCNFIVCALETIIGTIYDKKNTTIISIINMFVCSYSIDFANLFVPIIDFDNYALRIVFMIIGLILYAIGLGIEQTVKVGLGNFDIFVYGLKKRFNIKQYHTIRWPIDITFIVVGFILGAEVSFGTLIYMLFAGIIIERIKEFLEKIWNM